MITDKEKQFIATLDQVKQILEQQHLCYFLDTGTLLGAIRDKRFIPWDNDIDIGVITEKELTEADYIHLANIFYKFGFNVKVFASTLSINGIHHVMVDLKFYKLTKLGYESVLASIDKTQNPIFNYLLIRLTGRVVTIKGRSFKEKIDAQFTRGFHLASKFLPQNRLNQLFKQIGFQSKKVLIPKHYFENQEQIKFYSVYVSVPYKAQDYLAFRYGENWQIPNENYNYITDDQSLL